MKAALDVGHQVIGIKGSQSAIEAFRKENNIQYKVEKDKKNLLSLSLVDYIWDREKYRDVLYRMMTPGHTQLFLVARQYDDPAFNAPPHKVSDKDVNHLFGFECSTQLLEVYDKTEAYNAQDSGRSIEYIEERLHLIIQKEK